jgi:NitT/TauT family transport system ATP-binding protein
VLEDIDFSAQKGEFVAIVGKSGSGKTTFIKALAGLLPSHGEISVPNAKGMIFQNNSVFPWLTVSENIGFGLENHSKEKAGEIIDSHLKLTNLEDKKDRYPGELSGGQLQRVALARSIAHNPEVLFMDEPYSGLDVHTRNQMHVWLLDVWTKNKKTIIFVTHNLEEAIFLADRVLVLNDRKFVKDIQIPFSRPRKDDLKFTNQFSKIKKEIFESL